MTTFEQIVREETETFLVTIQFFSPMDVEAKGFLVVLLLGAWGVQ